MSQLGINLLKTVIIVLVVALGGFIGCAQSSIRNDPYVVLPAFKISKTAKRTPARGAPLDDLLIVGTVEPSVGQKITFETLITNMDFVPIEVSENYLGGQRQHKLQPGETISVTYSYSRQLQNQVIAEYHLKHDGSQAVSEIALSEHKDGFGCTSRGTLCRVMPLAGKGLPNFRFSIPVGRQTLLGAND